ncbi:uncharacterized protein LOC123322977 [Coccinella septempunctata]|uniref:uncharacterized protein LOC123322977 n=1 Tax=Coccinella septempunctata TaxID=41139 RepID=UPI001D06FB99|nr:uncharacterized protein LOC123322977 [Coccinella septempunctata]XP_044767036.1 uncharacterized protein LOC123322977 [Coccinella septempunctata]
MRRTRKKCYRNSILDENKENYDPNENATRERGGVGCDPVQQNEEIASRTRYYLRSPKLKNLLGRNNIQVSENVKEPDGMKNIITEVSSTQNKSDSIKPPFVCTICHEVIFKRCYAEAHLLRHNFSSCACSACESQMEIFKTLT